MRVYREAPEKSGNSIGVTVINSDDISTLSDEELNNKFSAVKRRIDQGRKKSVKGEILHALEIEHCYLYREISIRHARRVSHDKYMGERMVHRRRFSPREKR